MFKNLSINKTSLISNQFSFNTSRHKHEHGTQYLSIQIFPSIGEMNQKFSFKHFTKHLVCINDTGEDQFLGTQDFPSMCTPLTISQPFPKTNNNLNQELLNKF